MRKVIAILALLLAFVSLAAVSAQDSAPSGELVIALPNDPVSLFMPRTADRTAFNASWPIYDSLVSIDDDGAVQPALAESWTVSDDGLSYTFTLRQGVTFHNGEPFTAEAVVATWETGSDPSNDYANVYQEVSAVTVVDDFTVTITTAQPDPLFFSSLAYNWAIVPPAYIREVGLDAFAASPVGTGPFRFVERISGERIVYEANLEYWNPGQPKVASVIFRIIPDSSTRLAAIQTGEVDIVNRLSADETILLEGSSSVTLLQYPTDRAYYIAFKNVGNGVGTPLEDVRVRQALNYAINRPGIAEAIFGGAASTISGFVLPGNLGYDETMQPYPYDPDQARALLAEAGYAEGFQISMGCPADAYLNINEVCLSIQRDLSAVGIEVTLEFLTSNTFWSQERYGAVGPMYVDSWSSAVGEALPRLVGALIPGNYYNTWEDDTITDLINRISVEVDRDARAALYAELQAYMFENPPFVYLYQPNAIEAVNVRVQGYLPRAAEEFFLNNVSVSE